LTDTIPEMQALVKGNMRLAATVMLIRDGALGLEVFMVQRPGKGDFPDLHVFPGGKVDADDFSPEICFGLEDAEASERLGIGSGGLRYWIAVARECFEESGVLLACKEGKSFAFDENAEQRFRNHREQLLANAISFSEICRLENLQIDCKRLAYFSHWVTPSQAPRRFDTRFFVATMPADQSTHAYTHETVDDEWIQPGTALANKDRGHWQMIDPTLRSLETLDQYGTVQEALSGIQQGHHLMPLTKALSRQGMQSLSR
jgi:8-oxo-dGTP pyrophosphatase MutT (NUDIX family)